MNVSVVRRVIGIEGVENDCERKCECDQVGVIRCGFEYECEGV